MCVLTHIVSFCPRHENRARELKPLPSLPLYAAAVVLSFLSAALQLEVKQT
jgi:hypothetical protein